MENGILSGKKAIVHQRRDMITKRSWFNYQLMASNIKELREGMWRLNRIGHRSAEKRYEQTKAPGLITSRPKKSTQRIAPE